MKLSKEQIQFIDTYLKNNDVFYTDIRFEMIDHIASAVEEKMQKENIDFYDAFKNYMVKNKTEILKQNKDVNSFSWVEIKKYLRFSINPKMLIFGMLLLFVYKLVDIKSYFSKDFTFNNMLFIIIILVSISQIAYYFLYLKKRFYSIEKSGSTLLIIYYVQIFLNPFYKDGNIATSLFFFYLVVTYIFYFSNEIIKFQKQNNFIYS